MLVACIGLSCQPAPVWEPVGPIPGVAWQGPLVYLQRPIGLLAGPKPTALLAAAATRRGLLARRAGWARAVGARRARGAGAGLNAGLARGTIRALA